jgi:hypothetical protein
MPRPRCESCGRRLGPTEAYAVIETRTQRTFFVHRPSLEDPAYGYCFRRFVLGRTIHVLVGVQPDGDRPEPPR